MLIKTNNFGEGCYRWDEVNFSNQRIIYILLLSIACNL
ncbi:hypothetical protein ACP4OV_028587 [Aristida adscensionis]